MEHFYNNIQGWFDFETLYQIVVQTSNDNAHFVEVGTWKGKSAAFLAVEIINSGKNIKLDCVDTWEGSDEPVHHADPYVQSNTLYEHFLGNMKPVENFYTPVRMTSLDAAKQYADNSLDFVFIDAGHTYEDCYNDINAWLPKIKVGGYIAGHDYNTSPTGVRRAVQELLPEHTEAPPNSWIMKKLES